MKCPKCGGEMRSVFGMYMKCTKCSYPVFPHNAERAKP
jgi:DNA-directed RNA polymerase subunit RPC12/RpoP